MSVENNNKKLEQEEEEENVEIIYEPLSDEANSVFLTDMKQIPSIKLGDYKFELVLNETPELKEKAEKELRETPENIQNGLATLRDLLKSEKNLKAPIHHDKFLLRFLRACKFYPESAFKLIKEYYRFKNKHSDVYDGLLPSNEQKVFEQNILLFQQETDQHGRRIITIKFGENWDPNKLSLDEFFKGLVLLLELGLLEPQIQICGVVLILDMNELNLTQATKVTPMFAKRLLDWMQDAIPVRIKNIHVVKQPYIFKIIFKILKMFLRDKLKKRLILHGDNIESLHKYIDPECLLEEYGGKIKLPVLKGNPWLEILLNCDDEYREINTYGYLPANK